MKRLAGILLAVVLAPVWLVCVLVMFAIFLTSTYGETE